MKLLLDSHTLIWAADDPAKLHDMKTRRVAVSRLTAIVWPGWRIRERVVASV